jgi:ElaA protein
MSLQYTIKHFSELSTVEIYHILRLRIEVFCVEQNCPYQDCDGRDLDAYHIIGTDDTGELHAYCRLLDKGVSYADYASIGRVITSASYRGKGEGRKLMQYAIEEIGIKYVDCKVKISAQSYAKPFYESLGFEVVGEEYLEDDIPHVGMVLMK